MFRKFLFIFALVGSIAGLGVMASEATAHDDDTAQMLSLNQNNVYTVVYWNVRFPGRPHVYGTYNDWATAVRVSNFINSFPEYRAVIE